MALSGFGERLLHAVDSRGMSKRAFAQAMERTGVPGAGFSTVYGYFKDDGNPSVEFVLAAASLLQVDFRWLATGDADPSSPERVFAGAEEMVAIQQRVRICLAEELDGMVLTRSLHAHLDNFIGMMDLALEEEMEVVSNDSDPAILDALRRQALEGIAKRLVREVAALPKRVLPALAPYLPPPEYEAYAATIWAPLSLLLLRAWNAAAQQGACPVMDQIARDSPSVFQEVRHGETER